MRRPVVLALDPGPEAAVERVERAEVGGPERRQEAHAHRAEEALLLALARRLIGARVDERDAEPRAHQREVMGAEGRAVVDVQAQRDPAAHHRLAEDQQEGHGALREREGREGDDPGRVVEHADEVGLLLATAGDDDGGAVHDVAHPQLAGALEGEVPAVLRRRALGLPVHHAGARQDAVHGGERQRGRAGQLVRLLHLVDHHRHGVVAMLVLEVDERVDHGLRDGARRADVLARLGLERVEAALLVELDPVAHRLVRHARAARAGDAVRAARLLAQPLVQLDGTPRRPSGRSRSLISP